MKKKLENAVNHLFELYVKITKESENINIISNIWQHPYWHDKLKYKNLPEIDIWSIYEILNKYKKSENINDNLLRVLLDKLPENFEKK